MGTIQSCQDRLDQKDENSNFDFLNRICFCDNEMEESNNHLGISNSLEAHLLKLHVTQGPYLGTNHVVPDEHVEDSMKRHEKKKLNCNRSMCTRRKDKDNHRENDASVLADDQDENDSHVEKCHMLDISSLDRSDPPLILPLFDSPLQPLHLRYRKDRHHSPRKDQDEEEDKWSASTGRTSTSGSTDAADPSFSHPTRDISFSFTPRRLFGNDESFHLETTNHTNTTCPHRNHYHISSSSSGYIPSKTKPKYLNTLPSFIPGKPIRLKIRLTYGDNDHHQDPSSSSFAYPQSSYHGNLNDPHDFIQMNHISLLSETEHAHLFSYDPNFSSGQYCISTVDHQDYGNGLCVKMGAQYMTLQDQDGHIWGIIRSRNTFFPSATIYSPKERYPGQRPSYETEGISFYPWAMVQKHGRRLEHDVSIHMVADPTTLNQHHGEEEKDLMGGSFQKTPIFWSKHGFDHRHNHSHTHSVIFHVVEKKELDGSVSSTEEIPCCMSVRDMVSRDTFDVTIAPGIDPLIILCYMTAHSKMDVEPDLRKLS